MDSFIQKKNNFKEYYANNLVKLSNAEKSFRNLIYLLLANSKIESTPKVVSRLKDRNECIEKFNDRYRKKLEDSNSDYEIKDYITDLIGNRVICYYESDIKLATEILKANFDVIDETDKTGHLKVDTIGYKGFHLDLLLDKNRKSLPEYDSVSEFQFEVQIRSIVQDAWSELDHKLAYKKTISEDLKREIYLLAGLFEQADKSFDRIRDNIYSEFEEGVLESQKGKDSILNPLILLKFMKEKFPESSIEEYQIDGFLHEISELKLITINELTDYFNTNISKVNKYQDTVDNSFEKQTPYTILRYIFYLADNETFRNILFNVQRERFINWLRNN